MRQSPTTCTVEGCDRPYRARGYCNMHWRRWRTHNDPLALGRRPNGEGTIHHDGHVRVRDGGSQRYRYLVVWERLHGPIPKGLVVHHLDLDPTNDDPDNLCLMGHGAHTRLHMRLKR